MKRIFLTLAIIANIMLIVTMILGLLIGDAADRDPAVQAIVGYHFLLAIGSLIFAIGVHALVFTYFMGTGRWMEETCTAYRLPNTFQATSQSLKYRVLAPMMAAVMLLLFTGAWGAAADPASPVEFTGVAGIDAGTIHFLLAATTIGVQFIVNGLEYLSIQSNMDLIEQVMSEVRRIRLERGMPVS